MTYNFKNQLTLSKNSKNMSFYRISCALVLAAGVFISSCRKAEKAQETESVEETVTAVQVPAFSQDSAYAYIEKQVSFGPRVPGSAAQRKCADWMSSKLKFFGYEVTEQKFTGLLYDKKTVPGINLIASYKPEASKRILLAAHWDSRPISDKDPNVKNKAIDGANDGASGVGVLMEIARNLTKDSATVGVDFVLFDVEDWGTPEGFTGDASHTTYGGWCLGSEYWSKNPHKAGYTAYYGILLDMVGAPDAQFYHEHYSFQVAPSIVSNVWSTASQLGFGKYFINRLGGSVVDDHVPVIENLKIPMIDIIDYRMTGKEGFFPHHHTLGDNMSTIDKQTLRAVGQTVMHAVYQEK